MTREQAIEIVKTQYPHDHVMKTALGLLIPELSESEDERIRKRILDIIITYYGNPEAEDVKPLVAWLEKQKEQKPELYYDKELDIAAREFYLSGGANSPVDSTGLVPIVRMAEFGATWMKERTQKDQKPNFDTHWENGSMVCEQKEEKAEQIALKAYPAERGHLHDRPFQRDGFAKGYEQAEKDLALTWEDIAKIDALILEANNEFAVDYSKEISREQFYTEVLYRFNKSKEEQK